MRKQLSDAEGKVVGAWFEGLITPSTDCAMWHAEALTTPRTLGVRRADCGLHELPKNLENGFFSFFNGGCWGCAAAAAAAAASPA